MLSIVLIAALSQFTLFEKPEVIDPPKKSCTSLYFSKLVNAFGVPRSWDENKRAPAAVEDGVGELINDSGVVADGFHHWFYRDGKNSNHGYIVQVGGLAGNKRVYGPFPLPKCAQGST